MIDELPVIPRMGTPKMHMIERSKVIGWMPKPETRGTDSGKLTVRSSVKPLDPANDNLIDRTIALWRSRLGRDLSREDAREIAENVVGFFRILHEWSATSAFAPSNDNCAVSGTDEMDRPKGEESRS
jgi:hypothetical protein